MEVKYFKTEIWGDCYVPENDFCNVVSVNKKSSCSMAFDDCNLEGLYKPLKISQKEYDELRELAINKDRKKMMGLLKKIHEDNKGVLNSGVLQVQEITDSLFDGHYGKFHRAYENKKPILE